MPKIGLRNIKTAIAIGICLAIYFIVLLICNIGYKDFEKSFSLATKLYTPFFACIATAYSIHASRSASISQAKLRCFASLVGGLFGVLIIFLYTVIIGFDWPFSYISSVGVVSDSIKHVNGLFVLSFLTPIILTVLGTIVVIWICNLIKQPHLSFVAVLTFTSVMLSFGTKPIIYGFNRILSTIIGVLVALMVNMIRLPHHKNKDILFVLSLDELFNKGDNKIKGFSQYKLSRLIADDANIMLFSDKMPSTLYDMVGHVDLKMPVLGLSGSVLYDMKSHEYLKWIDINQDVRIKLENYLKDQGVNYFSNVIADNYLYTYFDGTQSEAERALIEQIKHRTYGTYIHKHPTLDEKICSIMILDTREKVLEIYNKLKTSNLAKDIFMVCYQYYGAKGDNLYLKIYDKSVENLSILDDVGKDYYKVAYTMSSHNQYLIDKCDKNLVVVNNKKELYIAPNRIFKEINRCYHKKNKE